ncbi:hypothetical protein L7F22_064234 [Adiantum nelumboides]|nr:hypothetical protein [Adiantum nelumboides]
MFSAELMEEHCCRMHNAARQVHGDTLPNPWHANMAYDYAGNHWKNKSVSVASQQMHCLMALCGLDSVSKFGDHVIRSFAMCGNLLDADRIFSKILKPTSYTWTAIILAHCKLGQVDNVFKLYEKGALEGLAPSQTIYSSILKLCYTNGAVEHGKSIHSHIVKCGFELDPILTSMLINMYIRSGSLVEASNVFNTSPSHDVVSWGTMIAGYTQLGKGLEAIEAYNKMQIGGVLPDEVTYSCILKACGSITAVELGKLIHSEIIKGGREFDVVVGNTIVDMYISCGRLVEARHAFDCLPHRNLVSWGTMVAGYVQHGHDIQALALFKRMQDLGVYTGKVTLLFAVKACCNIRNLAKGYSLHGSILNYGFDADVAIGSNLVDMYGKGGRLGEAQVVFDGLPEKTVYSWNAMILGYTSAGLCHYAFHLFEKMREEDVKPDKATFSCTFTACASLEALTEGRLLHDQVLKYDLSSDVGVIKTLLEMYAKCGDLLSAKKVFEKSTIKDVETHGILIAGYAQHGYGLHAIEAFVKMQSEGLKPDKNTLVSVLKACGLVKDVLNGRIIHDQITRGWFELDVVIGNTLVDIPGALVHGKLVHMEVVRNSFDTDIAVGTILVHMYAKFGHIQDAQSLFNGMQSKNIAIWNAMVGGYAQYGDWKQAKECLAILKAEGMRPVGTTYTNVLAACSHGGQVAAAHQSLQSITEADGRDSEVEHYNCFVDVLGRTGSLNDAQKMLCSMPVLPSLITWMSLLAACKTYRQTDLGRACFQQIIELDPSAAAGYTLMSNIYAEAQKWEDFSALQELQRCAGAWKLPGKAWIEVSSWR